MPYITKDRRKRLDGSIKDLAGILQLLDSNKGDLNYVITRLVSYYIKNKGGVSYGVCSDVTGVLNDVKVELERRVLAPYEDSKIIENGDVYDIDLGGK